jgi:hypothetical protein
LETRHMAEGVHCYYNQYNSDPITTKSKVRGDKAASPIVCAVCSTVFVVQHVVFALPAIYFPAWHVLREGLLFIARRYVSSSMAYDVTSKITE